MWSWLTGRRRTPPIPNALWALTLQHYPFLAQGSVAHQAQLRVQAAQFLAQKEFYGARGLIISDEIALAVAAQAVLPIVGLGLHWYDDFVGIVIYPSQMRVKREELDQAGVMHQWSETIAGEAQDGGPVVLNWPDVADAGTSAAQGYNLVIHEFAHKLDLRDGVADGCPPQRSGAARQHWQSVMQAQYQQFREAIVVAERFSGPAPWLDAYGAESVDEFFAVACEAYFVNRARFAQEFSPLADLFDNFFGDASKA